MILHEANSFAAPAPLAHFERQGVVRGTEIGPRFGPTRTEMGGFLAYAAEAGWRLTTPIAVPCSPAGPMDANAFAAIRDALVAGTRAAGKVDGVLLGLHGACVAVGEDVGTEVVDRLTDADTLADADTVDVVDGGAPGTREGDEELETLGDQDAVAVVDGDDPGGSDAVADPEIPPEEQSITSIPACASSRATSTIAALSGAADGSASSATASSPAPVAISTNESLVEVSPSMVMRLNEASAASRTRGCSRSGEMLASVATKPSMVAMFGLIMPAPLEMPVIVTRLPAIITTRDAALG
jgi:hypothetical protein